jgi:two-component system chemotaxis response regulator CheB
MESNEIVVVGTSWGGIEALEVLLRGLPATFQPPVLVVHHLGGSAAELGALLQRYSALPVSVPNDKERILPGSVLLAPAGYHLLVEPGSVALSTDGPVQHARPSIDVLFESAADAYAEVVIGVVLTGASQDGVRGAAAIKRRGGRILVQDPAEATSPTLPRAAIAAARPDRVLPLAAIAPALVDLQRHAAR